MQRQNCLNMNNSESAFCKEIELEYLQQVQELTLKRATKMSQNQISQLSGVSLKTVQRFENYQGRNFKLLFMYCKILLENA